MHFDGTIHSTTSLKSLFSDMSIFGDGGLLSPTVEGILFNEYYVSETILELIIRIIGAGVSLFKILLLINGC